VSVPLVPADDAWALFAIMAASAAGSVALERRYRWAARVTGPVVVIAVAIALSTAGVIPREAAAYDVVTGWFVPIAIPLLLVRTDLRRLWRDSGRTFVAFNVAAAGTVAGGLLAGWCLAGRIESSAAIAGIMTGSYTGGSVNFVSLQSMFRPPPEVASAAIVADNLVMALFFFVLLAVPSIGFIARRFDSRAGIARDPSGAPAKTYWAPRQIALHDVAIHLAVAVVVAAVSTRLGALVSETSWPPELKAVFATPYVYLTTLSILVATAFPGAIGRRPGAEEMGTLLLYFFFFVIGAPASVVSILRDSPALLVLCAIMLGTNLVVTLVVGRLLKLPLEDLLIASNATAGGPATAAAMAIGKGWPALVLPAVLVGVWGYAIGSYLGLFVGRVLGAAIGGGG